MINDIMASEYNITYTNIKDRNVANEFRERMNKKSKYETRKILINRQWIKQPRVNKTIRYRIVEIEYANLRAQISLQNITNDEDKFMVLEAGITKSFIYFIYSYYATCYASQGASVKESISIHE